jgi:hypothetical protein
MTSTLTAIALPTLRPPPLTTMVYTPSRHSQLRLEEGDVAQALHHVSNRAHRGEQ